MPEGDTIHRAAAELGAALNDQAVTGYWAYRPQLQRPQRAGHTVTGVEARGKNLLIHFDDGRALYSHMRMTGAWHVYGPEARWRRPQAEARVLIETPERRAVCFAAPVIELLTAPELMRHPTLSRLGPDLLAETLDEAEILSRIVRTEDAPIGELLLNQGVLAGIGNVYKSEMLFLAGLNPFIPARVVPEAQLLRLVRSTREMMQANLHNRPRVTRSSPGPDHWVYERARRPCLRCRRRVEVQRQGAHGRSTYFCPWCQRVRASP